MGGCIAGRWMCRWHTAVPLAHRRTAGMWPYRWHQGWQSVGPYRVYVLVPIRSTDIGIRIHSGPVRYNKIQVGLKFGTTLMRFGKQKASTDLVSGLVPEISPGFNSEMRNCSV